MSTPHVDLSETDSQLETATQAPTVSQVSEPQPNRFAIIFSILALYIIWGSTYLGMRVALQGFPPFLLAGIRFVIAGGIMFLFLWVRGERLPRGKEWLGAALIGGLLVVGGNGGLTYAEQWVPSGLTAVAAGAMPLWAALFAGFFGRWPSRFEWLGLGLGFVGLILLNLGNVLTANWAIGALLLLLCCPMAWALGSILSQHVLLPEGLMNTAAQMLCGGILLLLLGLSTGERLTRMPTLASIWAMLFLIAIGSWVAYTAYGYLLSHVRPSLATSYAYVNPIVAVALGVWLASEKVSLIDILAMAVILGGVVLVSVARGNQAH